MKKVCLNAMMAVCLGLGAGAANAAPLSDLSAGQTGRIEFNSITPPNRWEFVRKVITDVKGGGLGKARDYTTGAPLIGWAQWNKAFAACNARGVTVAANSSAKEQAVKEVIEFTKAH